MHQELGRRLVDAEARLAAQPTVDQLSEVVDQRIAAAQVGLVRSVDAQQAELQVAQAIDEMRQARDHLQQRLDSLVQQALEAEMRINALASSADAGAGQLHTLEQRIREAVNRFDTSVQERTREVAAWTVDNGAAASVGDDPGGDLVDALERQLQRAEGRLAHVAQYGSQSE
jgi:chromosome segregation ATPase